jgi:hypothetical protein
MSTATTTKRMTTDHSPCRSRRHGHLVAGPCGSPDLGRLCSRLKAAGGDCVILKNWHSGAYGLYALVPGPNADSILFKLQGTNEGRFLGGGGGAACPTPHSAASRRLAKIGRGARPPVQSRVQIRRAASPLLPRKSVENPLAARVA